MAEDGRGTGTGIVSKLSPRSVEDTVTRLADLALERGMKLFAVIDHAAEARAAGLVQPDATLVIFGDPVADTRVMLASSPLAGLDLPLRALVWDDRGKTTISYYEPAALIARHQVSEDRAAYMSVINALTDEVISTQPTR
jgi:uncharacterized protein (DUF302 family)